MFANASALELCKLLECELGDLLVTQTYGQFHRCCTNELVTITNKSMSDSNILRVLSILTLCGRLHPRHA
jgi:hypothetical protein